MISYKVVVDVFEVERFFSPHKTTTFGIPNHVFSNFLDRTSSRNVDLCLACLQFSETAKAL